LYVDLGSVPEAKAAVDPKDAPLDGNGKAPEPPTSPAKPQGTPQNAQIKPPSNRVFITHGKNKEILTQIKELLTFGSFQPVVSVEHETVSKPVPDKVMDDMRSCSAAIVHVGTELKLLDPQGNEHRILNPNVLIEIGAAMAVYGRRFILLVEGGVTLSSNLQGLYEVAMRAPLLTTRQQ
jgi:predicted nucleotide-binding protein